MADVFDALAADRPYHKALPKEKVLDILQKDSGTKLDAEAITILRDLVREDAV